MKVIFKLTFLYLFALTFCTAPSAIAASFSADMVTIDAGKTKTEKFYFSDLFYRIETREDGKPVVIIVDREKKVYRILDMIDKVFFELPSDDFRVMSNDPFNASEYMVSKYESKQEGMEKINGMECQKQTFWAYNDKLHARWVSGELNFPIKLVSYNEGQERYITELKNIKQVDLKMDLFKPPAGFKQVEEPGAAEKRKREEQKKKEEGLAGLTKVGTAKSPCYVKIAAGGELHISIDTDREAFLEVTNMVVEDSELTLTRYRDGKPSEVYPPSPWKLDRNGRNTWDFNDEYDRRSGDTLVDEVVIKVNKGLVYAYMRQRGEDRKDFYNRGNLQNGAEVDPKRPVTVHITGDNPFGLKTTGKFFLSHEDGSKSDVIPFTVENGNTLTWDYPASKGINGLDVTIKEGDGRAKISMIQPPSPGEAKASQTEAKTVTVFTVTHPSGAGKPLIPGKDLLTTITGNTDDDSVAIRFFTDRNMTKKVDTFSVRLKINQTETFFIPGYKKVGWAMVEVHRGSIDVKLDQSPGVKPASDKKLNQKTKKPAVKAEPPKSKSMVSDAPEASPPADKAKSSIVAEGTIIDGKVPLIKGASVIKELSMGNMNQVDLETTSSPEDIINFYKETMIKLGWRVGANMMQGTQGVIQFMNGSGMLTMKVQGGKEKSTISVVLMTTK